MDRRESKSKSNPVAGGVYSATPPRRKAIGQRGAEPEPPEPESREPLTGSLLAGIAPAPTPTEWLPLPLTGAPTTPTRRTSPLGCRTQNAAAAAVRSNSTRAFAFEGALFSLRQSKIVCFGETRSSSFSGSLSASLRTRILAPGPRRRPAAEVLASWPQATAPAPLGYEASCQNMGL
jgi:hypothetical protein